MREPLHGYLVNTKTRTKTDPYGIITQKETYTDKGMDLPSHPNFFIRLGRLLIFPFRYLFTGRIML